MSGNTLFRGFDRSRLRTLLAVFFLALSVPTAILIWRAFDQLKWESYHQYRGMAEELTERIDAGVSELITATEALSFADYTFLVVTGDPSANFLQRSPLSAYPVASDLPGVLGYFQVGADGEFSTPLLPQDENRLETYGIPEDELTNRRQLADGLRAVLIDNRLVAHGTVDSVVASVDKVDENAVAESEEKYEQFRDGAAERDRLAGSKPSLARAVSPEELQTSAKAAGDADGKYRDDQILAHEPSGAKFIDSQLAFDQLNEVRLRPAQASRGSAELNRSGEERAAKRARENTLGSVADLKLDSAYQKKSADLEKSQSRQKANMPRSIPVRVARKERAFVPEPALQAGTGRVDDVGERIDIPITTFESELDPLEFSLLDSGHLVLFRRVWRDGQRYVQGALIDQHAFFEAAVDQRFHETALSVMSDLVVAYEDSVLRTISGRQGARYSSAPSELDGSLLYRTRLSAPLNSIELIYSINRLPPGPGASVLGWLTLIVALVFSGGFFALYRMGLSQIALARQQQDFVSAVSHELKTPLTSIRMYGEMLKEGWADDEKKQVYYEFIHDESERLTRLIANVLQLANITRNESRLELQPTLVGDLMDSIEAKIATQVQRADFELAIVRDPEATSVSLRVDSDCFTQIVINLVDNAIKFSRRAERKRVEISAVLTSDNRIVFSVRDFGPGIPKDQMRRIFDMFYRSESELTRETVGTGIGLAIVHQLATAMGAKVDVMNVNPGASFRVSFAAHSTD